MKRTNINIYKCCRTPLVQSSIGIDAILEEIRYGTQFGRLVEKARAFGKGSIEFEEIKVNRIGTYTLNATFNGYRKEMYLISPTGLLYVDIDNYTEIDLSHPLIFAGYRSVSGTGMTVIVKVANLTRENLKPVYSYIGEQLGVNLDSTCAEITRQTVFSYDPEIVVNYESVELDALIIQPDQKRYISPLLTLQEERSSSELYLNRTGELVYNQNQLFDFKGQDFILFEEKRPTVEVYIPRVLKCGIRYMTISTIATNMCYLNPQLRDKRLYGFLQLLNSRCEKRLSKRELDKIYREITKKIESASLNPFPTRLRKIVFNPNCPEHVRRKMTAVAAGMVRSGKTYRKINDALDDWDLKEGRITNQKLAFCSDVHLNTLKRYLRKHPDLKAKKVEINNAIMRLFKEK